MASPAVAGTAVTNLTTGASSHVINLPASIGAGNGLLVCFGCASQVTGAETFTATGWTVIPNFYTKTASNSQSILGLYRDADGAEGATVTCTLSVTSKGGAFAYRITGNELFATIAPQCTTGVSGTGANAADPPAVGVTGGSADILSIACMAIEGEIVTGGVAPTNWTNLLQANSGAAAAASTNCFVQAAQRQETTATSDPGTFGYDETLTWVAQNIVIHPSGGAPAAVDPYPYVGGGYYPHQG